MAGIPMSPQKQRGNRLRKVKFSLAAKPGCQVFVAGSFNKWVASEHRMRYYTRSGNYSITLALPPGRYEYKFSVNGEWLIDPACETWVSNTFSTLNSVLEVK